MRLIDTRTIELAWFNDNEIPKYAILSHTWGADEVSYQEFVWISKARALSNLIQSSASSAGQDAQATLILAAMEVMIRGNSAMPSGSVSEEDLMKRVGYSKIIHAAEQARSQGCNYIWVDTCCIDKSSSAELQEAINSMFRWYRNAEVCIVYLGDVKPPHRHSYTTASDVARAALKSCRWVRRGWTLQELIAPVVCRFHFQDWTLMGEKMEVLEELADATGIPNHVLEDSRSISEISVAERMSWAAHRESTRIEDVAYCLLGIFDIHMPLLYGEGDKAFIRLQEQILRTTDDYSLFAWCDTTSQHSTCRGLLARKPEEFQYCRSIECENVVSTFPIGLTPLGLRVQLEFLPDPRDKSRVLAMIRSSNSMNQRLAISLKCLDGGMQYARVDAGSIIPIDDWPTGQLHTIYVRQKLSIPPDLTTTEFRSFFIRRRISNQIIPAVRIVSVIPPHSWDKATHELRIPDNVTEFWGALLLHVQSPTYEHALRAVAFGFNRSTGHFWCKAVTDLASSQDVQVSGNWPQAVKRKIPPEMYDPLRGRDVRHDIFVVEDSGLGINVSIEAGLCGDNIALLVNIDGLMNWE